MGTEVQHLTGREAFEKLAHIAKDHTAMLCTTDAQGNWIARPMATQGVDADGTVWFFSKRSSEHVDQLRADPRVKLMYMNEGRSEYVALDGVARESRDQAKIEELWSDWAKTWFPEGKQDPSLVLLAVEPTIAHYWDTKHGKVAQLFGMAVGAVTGKETDDSREGNLKV